ncbi:MAG: hypothetical protein M3302_06165, partial [Actinomycetota bacterium]|nr:hypothetical protein [Actinomycetota bacterium]
MGDLVDLRIGVEEEFHLPELEAFGDWKQVLELSNEPLPRAAPRAVNAGCSAGAASSPTWLTISSPRLAASRCT